MVEQVIDKIIDLVQTLGLPVAMLLWFLYIDAIKNKRQEDRMTTQDARIEKLETDYRNDIKSILEKVTKALGDNSAALKDLTIELHRNQRP